MAGLNWPRLLLRLLGRRLPRVRGRLAIHGPGSRITMRRDAWGIPHIEAASDADAWFGLGFCHAQDRGFQLELFQRVGTGTLAELLGPDALPIDRLSRRLGFLRTAERQLEAIDKDVQVVLDGYVAGINAGYATRGAPHELALLRRSPTPWSALDVLCFVGLQAFSLSSNWDVEMARLKVLLDDGPQAVRDLDPSYPAWHPVVSPPGAPAAASSDLVDRLGADLAALQGLVGGGGSNNWVIAGSRTATGIPILANDPHLAPRLPPPWYLAHLKTPEWELAGASFVGGPALPIGTNGTSAWGITAGLTDNTDLFLEEVGPDGASVREGDGFVACDVVNERIAVRGGAAASERILLTRRGPIVTALLDQSLPHALSLSAVWLRPLPIRGFLDVARARSFDEFRRAFSDWPGPSLNVVYADRAGHIGWQLVGQLPRRRSGNGTVPLPGWEPDNGWDGLVAFDEMPWTMDPTEGWLATANAQPVPDGAGPFLGIDFVDGYRVARIGEALAGRTGWDVTSSQRLQMDVTSLPWRELRDLVLGSTATAGGGEALGGTPEARTAREILAAWDGQVAADSVGASVYQAFVAELTARLARARAPRAWPWAIGQGFGQIVPRTMFSTRAAGRLVRLLRQHPEGWFAGSTWANEVEGALADAARRLAADFGADPGGWAWGRLRPLTLEHPLGVRRPLDRIFNIGPIPIGGDANTPMQVSSGPIAPFASPGFLANTRCVIDLANLAASRFSLAGGQSGNPLSRHYADLFELWKVGEGVPIAWTDSEVAAATRSTLILDPA